MSFRDGISALESLKEKCDSYVSVLDPHFEDLEEWKELLKKDVKKLKKGNFKGPVIFENPTSCSRIKKRHLYVIKESDSDSNGETGKNLAKDSKNQCISNTKQTTDVGESAENNFVDTYSHSPYLSSLDHGDEVEKQDSLTQNCKNTKKNSKTFADKGNTIGESNDIHQTSSLDMLNKLEQKSTRSSRRILRSINEITKTSVGRNTRNRSKSGTEENVPLIQKNKRTDITDQQIVPLASSDKSVLFEEVKNVEEVVSGTGNGIRVVKIKNKTTKASVKEQCTKNSSNDFEKIVSNESILHGELQCAEREESCTKNSSKDFDEIVSNEGILPCEFQCAEREKLLIKYQTDQKNRSTIILDKPKIIQEGFVADVSENVGKEEVSITRNSRKALNNNAKELNHSLIIQNTAANEVCHSGETKETRESNERKGKNKCENEINASVSNVLRSVPSGQCPLIDSNFVPYAVSENIQVGESLNENYGNITHDLEDHVNDLNDGKVIEPLTQSTVICTSTGRRESSVIFSSEIRNESLCKNQSKTFDKVTNENEGDSAGKHDTRNSNLFNVGDQIKENNSVETRKRSYEKIEDSQLRKRSCLIQENDPEKSEMFDKSKDTNLMEKRKTRSSKRCTETQPQKEISNFNSEDECPGLTSVEDETPMKNCDENMELSSISTNKDDLSKKQEYCKENIYRSDPDILKTTKRVTRSKARALNTAGKLGIANFEMKLNQNVLYNKKKARASLNKAIKTLTSARMKTQAGKENSNTSTSKKHFTPLMASKVLADVNVSSSSLLSSSKTTFTRPFTPQVMKPAVKSNIVTNVVTFIKKTPKTIDIEVKKEEEIKKREEKEKEVLRRKEEMLRMKAEEQKKKKEEQRLKVIHNREALEKEKQEMNERMGKEKNEKLNLLLQEREVKQKGNVLKKKQEMEKKAADVRRKIEEAEAARIAKQKQEEMLRKKVLEEAEKEAQKRLAEEKDYAILREKMEQKSKEIAQLKQKSALQKNVALPSLVKPTADLNTTWVKPTTSTNTLVKTSQTETINNAYFLDDLLSGDSDDEEENNCQRKTAPWAKRSRLLHESRLNILFGSRIKKMFSSSKTIDIGQVFPNKRLKRTSSAKWDTPPRYSCLPKY